MGTVLFLACLIAAVIVVGAATHPLVGLAVAPFIIAGFMVRRR